MVSVLGVLAIAMTLTTGSAGATDQGKGSASTSRRGAVPDLRVDANRDGRIDLWGSSDERLEDRCEALFLANLDDDANRFAPGSDLFDDALLGEANQEIDRRLLARNDAQDEIVNGVRDELDLARIYALPMPDAPDGATIAVEGAPASAIRLFIRDSGRFRVFRPTTEKVPAQALRAGLELLLEGRDIVRDSSWNGTVRLTLRLPNGAADRVQLRLAPLLLQHNLQTTQRVLSGAPPQPMSREKFARIFRDIPEYTYLDYVRNLEFAAVGYPEFRSTLDAARTSAGIRLSLKKLDSDGDRWAQDLFEPAYQSVPGPDGKPHIMRIVIRSAQSWRVGGRAVFRLRGPDIGVVMQFATDLPATVSSSLNSLGNLDSVPAHTAHGVRYPHGRILLGSGETRQPDPSFAAMLAAQKAQPLLILDTSWLLVGHVDEILQVVPAPNRRGWTLAVADPRGAVALLRTAAANGNGAAKLFVGRALSRLDTVGLIEPSIDELLADTSLIEDNEQAARHVDRVLSKLLRDLDLREHELVKLPVLFRVFEPIPVPEGDVSDGSRSIGGGTTANQAARSKAAGVGPMQGSLLDPNRIKAQKLLNFRQNLMLSQLEAGTDPRAPQGALGARLKARTAVSEERYFYAYSPNLANGLLLSGSPRGNDLAKFGDCRDGNGKTDWVFAYTKPDGPVVDGKDIFAQAAIKALGRVGVRPFEIDAWDWAHVGQGEVHCATNVWRDVLPDAVWWR